MRVRVSRTARADLIAAVTWWNQNHGRPSNLLSELKVARKQLERTPYSGVAVSGRVPTLRRLLLSSSRYVLFYEVDAEKSVVTVIRVWHMSRGLRPKL